MRQYLLLITLLSCTFIAGAQRLEWATYTGNLDYESTRAVCVDQMGNIYSMGYFEGVFDFDPGAGVVNLNGSGEENIFIQKHNPAGNLIWAREINADINSLSDILIANAMTIDSNANLIIVGAFSDTVDFDPGNGTAEMMSNSYQDSYILKLDSAGNYLWVKHLTPPIITNNNNECFDVATDPAGNILVSGHFSGTLDIDPGIPQLTYTASTNSYDGFFLKLDPSGDFIWARQLASAQTNSNVTPRSITFDTQGNICASGTFSGAIDFDPGVNPNIVTVTGAPHLFVGKYDATGNFLWVNTIGSPITSSSTADDIVTDQDDNIYLAGSYTDSIDIDPIGTQYITSAGFRDFFVEKFTPGGSFVWVKKFGGNGQDEAGQIIKDNDGNLLLVGKFYGPVDFNPDPNPYVLTATGGPTQNGVNAFILKLTPDAQLMWARHLKGLELGNFANMSSSNSNCIAIDGQDNLYIGGEFLGAVDFDFNGDTLELNSAGWPLIGNNLPDLYLAKISQDCAVANHCNEDGQSYTCYADYPYTNAPASACMLSNNDCSDAPDAWGFCRYNATSWVGWSVNKDNGFEDTLGTTAHFFNNDVVNNITVPGNLGDAVNWKTKLESTPFSYLVDNNPAPGSIAWWGDHTSDGSGIDASGHVAYVSCVDGDSVTLTEYNFGTNCFYNVRYIDNSLNYAGGNWKPDFYIHIEEPMLSVKSTSQNTVSFKVYPNPSNNIINVTLDKGFAEDGVISIYDVVGKEISRQDISGAKNYSFNLSGMASGLYFIQLSGTRSATQKFELIR